MERIDYSELFMFLKSGEKALLSGELSDWQHANTSVFHLLGQYILDINARLLNVEGAYPPSDQPAIDGSEVEIVL